MLKLAVVGKDVSRSLSPAMHTFLLGKMGVPCSYEAVSIPPVQFAARAQEQLANLRHCEMQSSVILSESDEHTLKKLGINLTCEPMYESKRLYHG